MSTENGNEMLTLGDLDSTLVLCIYRHCLCCARRDRAVSRRWRAMLPTSKSVVVARLAGGDLCAEDVRDLLRGTEMDRYAFIPPARRAGPCVPLSLLLVRAWG